MPFPFARDLGDALELMILVQPRASRTRILGEYDGHLKIQLAAPPVDGAANEALIAFLAECFGVPKRAVSLVTGATGRRKRIRIGGVRDEALGAVMNALQ